MNTIVAIAAIGSLSVVAIVVFAEDATEGLTALGAIIGPVIAALVALQLRGVEKKVDEQHLATNSRLDQVVDLTASVARAEGVLEGRAQNERERSVE